MLECFFCSEYVVASAAVQRASHLNLDEWTVNIAMLNCFLIVNALQVTTTALTAIYNLLYQKHVRTQVLK